MVSHKNKLKYLAFASVIMPVYLTGCGPDKNVSSTIPGDNSTTEASLTSDSNAASSESSVTESSVAEASVPKTSIPESTPETEQIAGHFLRSDSSVSYLVDDNGNILNSYDYASAEKLLLPEFSENYSFSIDIAIGDVAIYRYTDLSADERTTTYYAVNTRIGKYVQIPSGNYYFCNGDLYVDTADGTKKMSISNDLAVSSEDVDLTDFRAYLGRGHLSYSKDGMLASLEDSGYMVLDNNDVFYTISKDGKQTELKGIPKNSNINSYDKDHVIYYSSGEYFCLDINTSNVKKIPTERYETFLRMDSGKIYTLYQEQTDEYMMDTLHMYVYDVATGTRREFYNQPHIPGTRYATKYSTEMMAGNGRFFFQDHSGDKVIWKMVDSSDPEFKISDTSCVVRDEKAFTYGSVDYKHDIYVCPDCGKTLMKCYQEYYVLSDKYSEHATEINESIREFMAGESAADLYAREDEKCDYHADNEDTVYAEYEKFVYDVDIISDRFLTIDWNYYSMYPSAAHGYGEEHQLIYDLSTGKRLGNGDIFRGSEDEFKKLIATKTLEYAEKSGLYTELSDENKEQLYNEYYERASFENTNLKYYSDHVTLAYMQYEISSYAAGCHYIDISYEELIGEASLSLNE